MREALILGRRIGLMHKGRLVLLETPERFLAADHPQARAYLETLDVMDHKTGGRPVSFWEFLQLNWSELLLLVRQHVVLVFISILDGGDHRRSDWNCFDALSSVAWPSAGPRKRDADDSEPRVVWVF